MKMMELETSSDLVIEVARRHAQLAFGADLIESSLVPAPENRKNDSYCLFVSKVPDLPKDEAGDSISEVNNEIPSPVKIEDEVSESNQPEENGTANDLGDSIAEINNESPSQVKVEQEVAGESNQPEENGTTNDLGDSICEDNNERCSGVQIDKEVDGESYPTERDSNTEELGHRVATSESCPSHNDDLLYFIRPQNPAPTAYTSVESPMNGEVETQPSSPPGNTQPTVEYGFLPKDAALGSALILQNVLIPAALAGDIPDADLGPLQKFVSRAIELSSQKQLLPVPEIDLTNVDSPIDITIIEKLEVAAADWIKILSNETQTINELKSIDEDPISEINLWRKRQSMLSEVFDETQKEPILQARKILETAKSSVSTKLEDTIGNVVKFKNEAVDTCKFLSTIESHLLLISSESFPIVLDALRSFLESVRVVWTVSRYYNREERLLPLLKCVSWKLAQRAKDNLNLKDLLVSFSHEEAKEKVLEAKQLLEGWRQAYSSVRASISESGLLERRWDFDSGLFSTTDFIADICGDLYEMIDTISMFQIPLAQDLADISDEQEIAKDLMKKMQELPNFIESISFDLFDEKNREKWNVVIDSFHQNVKQTESYTQSCIERSFNNLCSAEKAFVVLENYKHIRCRPPIKRMSERYENILERYLDELDSLERKFAVGKESPPISDSLPPTSGAISWADSLYLCAKLPILRFNDCSDGILSSELGITVKSKYLHFARSIDSYKNDLFSTWVSHLSSQITEGLKKPVLKRATSHHQMINGCDVDGNDFSKSVCDSISTRKSRKVHVFNPSLITTLESNFPNQIIQILDEAKHMEGMGFKVPNYLADFMTLEEEFMEATSGMDQLADRFNNIIGKITELEGGVMKAQLEDLNHSFSPGLTKLNWMSQRVMHFVASSHQALDKFSATLIDVRKQCFLINAIITSIENKTLLDKDDFVEPLPMKDFCDRVLKKVEEQTLSLVAMYRSIKPFLLIIEMSTSATSEGASFQLTDFYFYLQKRICNAVAQVVVRSLANLDCLVRSRSQSPVCLIKFSSNGNDITICPTKHDAHKLLDRCIRTIAGSPKKFIRWMSGTCLEAVVEVSDDQINAARPEVSFYDALKHHQSIVECVVMLKKECLMTLERVEAKANETRLFQNSIIQATAFPKVEVIDDSFNMRRSCVGKMMKELSVIPRGEMSHPMLHTSSFTLNGWIQIDSEDVVGECKNMVNSYVEKLGTFVSMACKSDIAQIENQISQLQTSQPQPSDVESLDNDIRLTLQHIAELYNQLNTHPSKSLWETELNFNAENVLDRWSQLVTAVNKNDVN